MNKKKKEIVFPVGNFLRKSNTIFEAINENNTQNSKVSPSEKKEKIPQDVWTVFDIGDSNALWIYCRMVLPKQFPEGIHLCRSCSCYGIFIGQLQDKKGYRLY